MATISDSLVEAVSYHQLGQFDRAETIYRQVLQTDPNQADALHLLGVLAHQFGRQAEAVDYISRAIELHPGGVSYYVNLGLARHTLGRLTEAVDAYRQALQLDPAKAEAYNNLGNVFRDLGRHARAGDCYREAIHRKPGYAQAHYNLGNVLKDRGRLPEAVARYRQAIGIQPNYARAHQALGDTLGELGQLDEAVRSFHQVAQLGGDSIQAELKIASLAPPVFENNDQIDQYQSKLQACLDELAGRVDGLDLAELSQFGCQPPFDLLYQGRPDRPIKEAYAAVFRHGFAPPAAAVRKKGLPRIGFVVTHPHEGVFIRCMRGILEQIRPGLFELVVIALPGGAARLRAAIANQAVEVVTIPEQFDRAAEAIGKIGFDLLYFWEIGTDADNYFLPFCRLAPVQCTSWGVPATSGIPQVDYYLSSELVETADAQDHYTERLYRAKTLLAYEYRLSLPESPQRREDFGFSNQQHLYLCSQQPKKLHPDFDPILAGILQRDPSGVVVLFEDRSGQAADALRKRFLRTIPPTADRIVFVRWQKMSGYTSLLAASDVVLDTLYYGGALTCYDAFSFDQPMVTLPTPFRRGRYALGCYRKMGIEGCVAKDPQEYVQIAVRLGCDREYRQAIREQIRVAAPLLFEDLESVRELEQFFVTAIQRQRCEAAG